MVDPIDGTRDYLRDRPGWCVSVALVEDRVPVLGVLAAPARGELWTAARGRGSLAQRRAAPGQRRAPSLPARGCRRTSCPRRTATWSPSPSPIRSRSASPWSPPARPICVATLRWGFEWDIAAAALIAEEAGATVSGALGQPLAFNTASGEAFGVLVATPGIHAAAVERLRERAMAVV